MKRISWLNNVGIAIVLSIATVACSSKEDPLPALYATLTSQEMEDFVYTNNGYLLTFTNNGMEANKFKMYLKADDKKLPIQPVFPLSLRDSLFAKNLIYVLVGKEGESWLLFDKTDAKKDAIKRYKLVKYDFLSRVVLKTYFILPIAGRSLANVSELQINEQQEMIYYIDNEKNDFVALKFSDGTFKSFAFPSSNVNSVLEAMKIVKHDSSTSKTSFKIALNREQKLFYIVDISNGKLYYIDEGYLISNKFYSRDIQSQIRLKETDLKDVVDVEFDNKQRPIVATKSSIYIVRSEDKLPIVKNFRYGDITAISYTKDKVYFSVKSNKYNIYSIDIVK